ncbi:hypothetical protein C5Y96_03050 [Blastopirellula marina]|uniref:Chromosome segregation protein SMC n=1 Tax=Blastopirellula marina TaxID=124 RepID=A0A2S8G3Z4_9BACT|nr:MULTISPECIES: hypothetical protein [Pirellulaceae]PQO38864.1 hypothetical protein C5Y96_03050 [Blastopirellula marina]RCS55172.1 hypothetical protein DTL36_03055 [Bremerella cremea]
MQTSTLFPLHEEPLAPAAGRRGPVLWLQRVIILSQLDPTAVIRDISFRLGLNIIKTKKMKVRGGPVAGHSVGKTLLMRMIRYTLGEQHFGTQDTQDNLASTLGLENAHVVAQWNVQGQAWTVIRPLRVDQAADSYAVATDDWQAAITAPDEKIPHKDFVLRVQDAMLSELPQFSLPRGREARWLDILAWLSRDYQCGYRKANEWRHDDANPGATLDRDENSLIMQWVMGLMNADEVELRLKHGKLLKDRGHLKTSVEQLQRRLDTLWEPLRETIELGDEAEMDGDQPSFDSVNPVTVANKKVRSLTGLRSERVAESKIAKLQEEYAIAQQAVTDAAAAVGECQGRIKLITQQIAEYEIDPTKPFVRCQAESCWIKERAKQTANDPARDSHLDDFREKLEAVEKQIKVERQSKKALERSAAAARDALTDEEKRLAKELSSINQKIGQWKGVAKEALRLDALAKSVSQAAKKLKKADSDVENSLKTLEELRRKYHRKLRKFSSVYDQVLKEIFGPTATGDIQVDGNGLHPAPDKRLAPAGAAMSVMTTVLAFDVSCLAASVYGIGHHPRLLLHDSPREGDMEGPLFGRLFEIVEELESKFDSSHNVSFQYIVTTTSEPPRHLASSKGPYVVETLDATTDDGLLMRKRF